MVTNITSSIGLQFSYAYVLNEFSDGFHYYLFGNSGSPQNPSTIFPTVGTTVNIASVTFDIPVTPTIVLTQLFPVQNLSSEWFYYRTGFMTCNKNEDNLMAQSVNITLPIYLSTFSATKHSEHTARLYWTTSSEVNSDYFGIERSIDGESWDDIGRVSATGNSSRELDYEYIDRNLPLGRSKDQLFYYRLRLTDLDGTFKYSDIRGVNFDKQSTRLVTIYPNPTLDLINVDLSGIDLDNGKIHLSVYDMSGKQLITKSIIGNGIELIHAQSLPAGPYNVVVQQGTNLLQQRIVKID
ncbi:MAG: T9SS type A sorting domain-containing protein [Saprospiraceae bacterium]|nr:T9SS type A sorting domain-containing protein [Saprospiraceae bacterium]